MPTGLQTFDPSGNIIVDITSRLGAVLGVADIAAGVDGNVTNAGFARGTPFWMATALSAYATYSPAFSFDAGLNRLSWSWGGRTGPAHKLVYGVF